MLLLSDFFFGKQRKESKRKTEIVSSKQQELKVTRYQTHILLLARSFCFVFVFTLEDPMAEQLIDVHWQLHLCMTPCELATFFSLWKRPLHGQNFANNRKKLENHVLVIATIYFYCTTATLQINNFNAKALLRNINKTFFRKHCVRSDWHWSWMIEMLRWFVVQNAKQQASSAFWRQTFQSTRR